MDVSEFIKPFLDIVTVGKVNSAQTVAWYQKRLTQYLDWASLNYPDSYLSRFAFNGFIAHLKNEKYSPTTVRGYVVILRRFGRWLLKEQMVSANPADDLKLPPKPKSNTFKGISDDDVDQLLAAAGCLRDRALIMVLRDSGARAEEVLNLRWGMVNLEPERGRAQVVGKGMKERPIFFRAEARQVMLEYKESVPHGPDDPVWRSFTKKKGALTYTGLYQMLKRLAREAGVKRFNPHAFRHRFGHHANKKGCSTLVLQGFMGHASPTTTLEYCYMDEDDMASLHETYVP